MMWMQWLKRCVTLLIRCNLLHTLGDSLKKIIRKLARSIGIEITRYRPSNSAAAQLVKALEVAGINVVFDIGANEVQFARG